MKWWCLVNIRSPSGKKMTTFRKPQQHVWQTNVLENTPRLASAFFVLFSPTRCKGLAKWPLKKWASRPLPGEHAAQQKHFTAPHQRRRHAMCALRRTDAGKKSFCTGVQVAIIIVMILGFVVIFSHEHVLSSPSSQDRLRSLWNWGIPQGKSQTNQRWYSYTHRLYNSWRNSCLHQKHIKVKSGVSLRCATSMLVHTSHCSCLKNRLKYHLPTEKDYDVWTILHAVLITTHKHDRRKSIGK